MSVHTPDSRAAPRLRFSEDEQLPGEQAEPAEKLTRKIKWQLPKEAEAQVTESVPQGAAIQPLQKDRAAEVTSSDEIVDEPLLGTTRHGVDETSRHRRSSSKALPKKRIVTQNVEPPKKKEAALRFEEQGKKAPSRMKHKPQHRAADALSDGLHRHTQQSNEDDNLGVTAADSGVRAVESTARTLENAHRSHQLRSQRRSELHAGQRNSQAGASSSQQSSSRLIHGAPPRQPASANAVPSTGSNPLSRLNQRRGIRKGYLTARSGKTAGTAQRTARGTSKAVKKTGSTVSNLFKSKHGLLLIGLIAMLTIVMGMVSACAPLVQAAVSSAAIGTYPATEDDVLAAERAYANMERELQREIDRYETRHPEYDEYRYDVDDIWHDPHALIAIISARFNGAEWTLDAAYPVLETYFALQYDLEEDVRRVTRYDEYGEPYTYSICTVTLTNNNLSHQPVYSMSRRQMGLYAMYMSTLGNMPDIFSGNPHASTLREPVIYDVPQEYLDADPSFARLMEEANKYVGYPYVWGGDSPETSFDCSGFLSYVYTATGVRNTGRLGATGLYGVCDPVAPEDARPGDMVFFQGTMGSDVGGITHCGLYVGDGWMIHCGNPIGYADLTDSYWQSHFYGFGRAY